MSQHDGLQNLNLVLLSHMTILCAGGSVERMNDIPVIQEAEATNETSPRQPPPSLN